MNRFFAPPVAVGLNLAALFLILAVLIATPIRSQIFAALLMLYAIGYLIANRATLRITRFDWAVVGLLTLYLLSHLPVFVLSGYSSRYLSPGFHMLAMVPIYLMLRHLVGPLELPRFRHWLEWGVIVGNLGAFVLGMYQLAWLGERRIEGFLFSINFGYLSCAMGFLALALVRGSARKGWLLAAGIAVLIACVMTLSRGAILAIPVLLVLLLALNVDRLGWKLPVGVVASLVGLSLLAYGTVAAIQERVHYSIEEVVNLAQGNVGAAVSSGGRLQLWKAASHAFAERPLVGLTYDEREAQIDALIEQGELTKWVGKVSRGHAHSQYFEMAATGGVLGLIALVGFLVVPGVYQLRLYLRDRSNDYALTAVLFTSGFAIYSLTEVAIDHELMVTFYAYMQVTLLVLAVQHSRVGLGRHAQ
ncbi:O-antigen ligase family protein [Billgrantia lactosivorans]|uniref:O-antigen ligase family protein n=1 Tax=Billgrantia lactosivorans TaxID=2185141 RepID=UPI0013A6EB48|nr:O-antigen ligase family protein [Halomonas lactosivorans]